MYSFPSAVVGNTIEPSKLADAKLDEYKEIVSVEVINSPLFTADAVVSVR